MQDTSCRCWRHWMQTRICPCPRSCSPGMRAQRPRRCLTDSCPPPILGQLHLRAACVCKTRDHRQQRSDGPQSQLLTLLSWRGLVRKQLACPLVSLRRPASLWRLEQCLRWGMKHGQTRSGQGPALIGSQHSLLRLGNRASCRAAPLRSWPGRWQTSPRWSAAPDLTAPRAPILAVAALHRRLC